MVVIKMKLLTLFFGVAFVNGYGSYRNYVPNAENVYIDGVQYIGLGHPSATATSDQGNPNVFGIQVRDAHAEFGRDPEAIWSSICETDPDGDGILNKDELCDPDCSSPGLNPPCEEGKVPTHPAFPDINGESTAVVSSSVPLGYTFHGLFMMVAWIFAAPYGVLKVIVYKKRKSAIKPPVWFKHHVWSMRSVLLFHIIGLIAIFAYAGFEPISEVFDVLGVHRESRQGRHIIMGLTLTILLALQIVSGLRRAKNPPPGEPKSRIRKAWEFQHQYMGRFMLILSFVCVYTGLELTYKNGEVGSILLAIVFAIVGAGAVVYAVIFREEVDAKYEEKPEIEVASKVASLQAEKVPAGSKHSENPMFENPV